MLRRLPHGSRLPALLAMLALLPAAGCGSSGSTPPAALGPDPAAAAPADAPVYFQATVRPTGDMKAGLLAAARKVSRMQDPGAALRRALDSDRSGGVVFSRDVEPWLGRRLGGFLLLSPADRRHPDFAVIAAIADRGRFDAAYARIRKSDLRPAGSYHGVAYEQEGSDRATYAAPVGRFFVIGTLAALRAAIDARHGASLASDPRFRDAAGRVPSDAIAFAYGDPSAILAGIGYARQTSPGARAALAKLDRLGPTVVSLTASADRIALDASARQPRGTASDAGASVAGLPGDAWLALATPPLGPVVRAALVDAGVHTAAVARVRQATGLDLDRDLLDPLGGLSLFVRGSSPLDVGGGALLQMTSAAAAQLLATRIEEVAAAGLHAAPRPLSLGGARGFEFAIPQAPQPVVVVADGGRLAAGYGASSARDLLHPQQRLDASPAGKAALATLGAGYTPSLVIVAPPLVALLRSLDALQVVHVSSVVPYLEAYRSLALGTKRDGGRFSLRLVAALR